MSKILRSKTVSTQYKLVTSSPVVQSIVSVTSSLVVKMLTVLVSTLPNSQVFLLKKWEQLLQICSHFFSKNIRVYATFIDQSFKDTLTNDIIRFEQLGPGSLLLVFTFHISYRTCLQAYTRP